MLEWVFTERYCNVSLYVMCMRNESRGKKTFYMKQFVEMQSHFFFYNNYVPAFFINLFYVFVYRSMYMYVCMCVYVCVCVQVTVNNSFLEIKKNIG